MTEISGSSNIPTELGMLTIGQIAGLHLPELNDMLEYKGPKIFLENGFLATPRFFYISRLDNLVQINLADGTSLKARKDQKVLTPNGFKRISALEPRQTIGVVPPHFQFACIVPNKTEPAMDMFKHPEYLDYNIRWVPITNRKTLDTKEPGFTFAIPYYKRFIANGIICSD